MRAIRGDPKSEREYYARARTSRYRRRWEHRFAVLELRFDMTACAGGIINAPELVRRQPPLVLKY